MSFETPTENIFFPKIAVEIKQMVDVDQAMRERSDKGYVRDEEVDARNTARMKEIFAEIVWLTISKVGQENASNARLLVQHADHDVNFRLHCLQLMQEASGCEVDRTDIAYLKDRVRVDQGQGQLYGTQFTQENNRHVPRSIEDEDNVDKRRAEIGMGPLSEQVELIHNKYPFKEDN